MTEICQGEDHKEEGNKEKAINAPVNAPVNAHEVVEHAERLKEIFLRVAAAMTMADGKLDDAQMQAVVGFCQHFTGESIDKAEITHIAETFGLSEDSDSLSQYLQSVSADMAEPFKDVLIQGAYYIATIDGDLAASEKKLLGEIAKALAMPDERLDALLVNMKGDEGIGVISPNAPNAPNADGGGKGDDADLAIAVLVKTMASMAMADGVVKKVQVSSMAVILQRLLGREVKAEEIDQISASLSDDDVGLVEYLQSIEDIMTEHLKEDVIRAASLIASVDRQLAPEEAELLKQIAAVLKIPHERLDVLLSE